MPARNRFSALCDALLVLIAGLTASAAVFGGVRLFAGNWRISITSVVRLLVVAAAVAAVRLAVAREPSVPARLHDAAARVRGWWHSRATQVVIPVWIATRLGVILVGFLASSAVGPPPERARLRLVEPPALDLAAKWDTGWYLQIAVGGYEWDPNAPHAQQNIAFFPAYPLLMHVGGALLGARPEPALRRPHSDLRNRARTLAAGWMIALAAALFAMRELYRWTARLSNEAIAGRAVWLLSAYPFAVYFSAAYTEPLFLLAAIAAFNAAASGRAVSTGSWALFASLLRPNGVWLCVPLAILAAQKPESRYRLSIAAAMPGVGLTIFSMYNWWLTGHPLSWMLAHTAWGRRPFTWDESLGPAIEAVSAGGLLPYVSANPITILNAAALMFTLGMLPVVWRRLGAAPAVFVIVNVVPPLMAGGLMSMGRLTATMFPTFVALALVIPRRHVPAWVAVFAMLQGLAAALFFTWRPLV